MSNKKKIFKNNKRKQDNLMKHNSILTKLGRPYKDVMSKKSEYNHEIIRWFELLIKQIKFDIGRSSKKEQLKHMFRLKSITKSLDVIKGLDFNIKSGKEIKDYKGIGKGTIDRIDQILNTGQLDEVREAEISGEYLDYLEELEKIFGIGEKKAYELYKNYNIKSISDLKKAVKSKKIDLPDAIKVGLKYFDQIERNIPRSEIDEIYSLLIKSCIEIDPDMSVIICGSYRRMKDTSNDVDVIISHPSIKTRKQAENSDLLKRFINYLENTKFIVDSFTSKDVPTKYMGLCRLNKSKPIRRIDVRFFAEESYYYAILYFTGSVELNVNMRKLAESMDYKLNEYGLYDSKGQSFKVNSEKEIFNLLGMEYLQPEFRKG